MHVTSAAQYSDGSAKSFYRVIAIIVDEERQKRLQARDTNATAAQLGLSTTNAGLLPSVLKAPAFTQF